MHQFRQFIAIILLSSILFSLGTNSLNAVGEEVYSLQALPFADISEVNQESSMESDTIFQEEGRLMLLDSVTQTAEDETDTNLPSHVSFSYSGIDETRVLLADMRTYHSIISPREDIYFPSNVLSQFFLTNSWSVGEFFSSGSSEVLEFPKQEFDLPLPVLTGKRVFIDKKARKTAKISSLPWDLAFEFQQGTEITTGSGETIDTTRIWFQMMSEQKKSIAKAKYEKKMKNRWNKKKWLTQAQVEGFEFGLPGVHLIFSKPVKITINTPNMSDGVVLDLLTMHEGDSDFHTGWLSISPDTLCSIDGTASKPGSQAIVKNGKVVFYTCGASLFTMNPTWGTAGSNDLKMLIGDCAQVQIYYNNLRQIYNTDPPGTGCAGTSPGSWAMLRIWGVTYGNGVDGVTATAWSTQTTTGVTLGNTYNATSTMTRVVGGRTYTLSINWIYTAPNKYFTWSYRVIIPTGNTLNVRFYMGNDSTVAGGDANDAGYFTNTGGQTVGNFDSVANVLSAYRYMSGTLWTGYEAWAWNNITTRINGGTDFNNTISTTADQGFWVNWNFGTTPATHSGTVEWRLLPYSATPVVDLIPWIGSPEGQLTSNLLSQLPINISNAGTLSSSWVHTAILTIPANIVGPASPFSDNGWSCGAQVWTGVTCTKTTSVTGSLLGDETFRIPVTPNLAASGSNVTFYVDISGWGDSNLTNNRASATNSVIWWIAAIEPGWIAGENLWLMGNNGTNCSVTGCAITNWANRWGLWAAASGTTGLWTVTYDPANSMNYNPTLYFNNASLNTNNNLGITASAASVFTVTKIGAWWTFSMGPQTAIANAMQRSTSPTLDVWQRYIGTVYYNGANARSANIPAITTTLRQTTWTSSGYTNGRQLLSSVTAGNFTASNIWIGRVVATNSTLSNLAEVIVYPNGLSDAQKNQVESYLAIKYGISLDQTTPKNYLWSNGSVIWNAGSAGIYKNNIAGIARDDITTLNQNRSQSIYSTGDIIVYKAAIGTNRNALIWSNDSGSTLAFTGNDAAFGYQRITREWLFQEKNGDIGTVTVSYPNASVPAWFTGRLMMLTDSDWAFATGAIAYTGTYNTGATTWDFSVNISDLQYTTFWKTIPTDTTPPSITSINIASWTLIPTWTFSLIASYSDTWAGINPASFSGRIYAWDATGATWSLTNIAPSYMLYSWVPSTSSWGFDITNLPFGKYRFDIIIADTAGNTLIQSYTYFVDQIEWTLSSSFYNIGNAPLGTNTFWTWDYILTVRTVWAWFNLTLIRSNDLSYSGETITVYNGTNGWWYDKNIGAGYSSLITAHGTTQTLVTTPKNINTNGLRNTFTYAVKFWVNPSSNHLAWDYQWNVAFWLNLTY
jgi:hypothetical protein